MTLPTYNPDRKYEMMAALLPSEGQNTPDAESIVDDLRQILLLCYEFTINRNEITERVAGDLADAIVAYLFNAWTSKDYDFEQTLKDFYVRAGLVEPEGQPEPPAEHEHPAESAPKITS